MSSANFDNFITERIDEGLNFSRSHRFFLLYGQRTSDEFLTQGMLRASLCETLWASLKRNSFGCVVFYNAADNLFFLDEESRRLSYPPAMATMATHPALAAPGNGRMQRGPLGDRNVLRGGAPQFSATALAAAQPSSSSPATSATVAGGSGTLAQAGQAAATGTTAAARPRRFSAMSDAAVLRELDQLMLNATTRTAIVIEDLENLSRFDHQIKDQLAAGLKNWGALKSDNRNVVVFISAREAKDEESERAMKQITGEFLEIANLVNIALGQREEASEGFVLCVPPPFEAEVERLIDEQRLLRGLRLNWPERDKVTRWLAAENKSLKQLDGLIHEFINDLRRQETDEISIATVKRRGWISGDSDPRPAMERLEQMIGMAALKKRLKKQIAFLSGGKILRESNPQLAVEPLNLHFALTGNPGTGKTTIVRLMGEIYRDLGLLRRGHMVECTAKDLVAGYVGQTAPQTNAKINEALDGVLFIDEAYELSQGRENSFGQEVITTLLARMENERHRLAVIVGGYPEEMSQFITSNPGLRRHFITTIHIEDYSAEELYQIFERMVGQRGFNLGDEMCETMRRFCAGMFEARNDKSFFPFDEKGRSSYGNAEEVRNMLERMIQEQALRLGGDASLELTPDDIAPEDRRFLNVAQQKQNSLEELMAELNALVGVQPVKEMVRKLVNEQHLAPHLGHAPTGANKTQHMLFLGNPGTGKTTVAWLIGRMFRSLGLLKKGHFTEVKRQDLVAEYVGQSGKRTKEKVESALDGVLFVDEAYALVSDPRDSFGKEVISTLITCMEDYRDRLVVIFAGYTREMQDFLNSNSGIASRVGYTLEFTDYTGEEMLRIFLGMAAKDGYLVTAEVQTELLRRFTWLYDLRDPNFGNVRGVRVKFYEKMIENFNERFIAALDRGVELEAFPKEFLLADIPNVGLPPGGDSSVTSSSRPLPLQQPQPSKGFSTDTLSITKVQPMLRVSSDANQSPSTPPLSPPQLNEATNPSKPTSTEIRLQHNPPIFISYRRQDSDDITGRIYDRLIQHFGEEAIFRDVDSIRLGVDFRKSLEEAIGNCNLLLVVIGRTWLRKNRGKRKIDDPQDFVRIEIEAALLRGIPIIPLLVQGASLPTEDQVPASLQPLIYRNATTIRGDPDFRNDVDRLIKGIELHIG